MNKPKYTAHGNMDAHPAHTDRASNASWKPMVQPQLALVVDEKEGEPLRLEPERSEDLPVTLEQRAAAGETPSTPQARPAPSPEQMSWLF